MLRKFQRDIFSGIRIEHNDDFSTKMEDWSFKIWFGLHDGGRVRVDVGSEYVKNYELGKDVEAKCEG